MLTTFFQKYYGKKFVYFLAVAWFQIPGPPSRKSPRYCSRGHATGTLGPDREVLDKLLGGVLLKLARISRFSGLLMANSSDAAQSLPGQTGTYGLRTCLSSRGSMATLAHLDMAKKEQAKKSQ